MKNLIIGIVLGIAISSVLGATLLTTTEDCSKCGVYCDNTARFVQNPLEGGGEAVSLKTFTDRMKDAKPKLSDPKIIQHAREYYILSKQAIEEIFNHDNSATGVLIATYFDNYKNDPGSINLMIAAHHTKRVNIARAEENLVYQIKTFCPEICDEILITKE